MTTVESPTRLLRVDLSDASVQSEPIPPSWRRAYLGGKGLGARYLYEELEPGVDPLGTENVLCLFRGPLSGHLPGETRIAAITKSPLTGIFVDSYTGGAFAERFVAALDDHIGILIEGRAASPVELYLEDGELAIESAKEHWGLDTVALSNAIDDGEIACIGPAGEAHVHYATIATDGGDHHAGRGGTGAVMGAKHIKAIIADGDDLEDSSLEAVTAEYEARFSDDPRGRWHHQSGTVETVDAADIAGVLPTRGWTEGSFEGASDLGIEAISNVATDREGEKQPIPGDFEVDGVVPRGGLTISLGANLGIDEMDEVIDLGSTCDALGLDVIEAGNALAWAMLASTQGFIDRDITFGEADAARTLLDEIARRASPVGRALADGIDGAADTFGGDDLIPTVKSMAVASYDPRPAPSMALAFATSDRGACHRRARPVFEETVDAADWDVTRQVASVIDEQNLRSLLWCYIADDVTAPAFEDDLGLQYFESLDWEYSMADLETIGERVWTLTRLFNVREGISAADDQLPAPFDQPLRGGPHAGDTIEHGEFNRLLQQYYETRSWGPDGRPTATLLERLGLLELADADMIAPQRPEE